jgi:hypothetical protein
LASSNGPLLKVEEIGGGQYILGTVFYSWKTMINQN